MNANRRYTHATSFTNYRYGTIPFHPHYSMQEIIELYNYNINYKLTMLYPYKFLNYGGILLNSFKGKEKKGELIHRSRTFTKS